MPHASLLTDIHAYYAHILPGGVVDLFGDLNTPRSSSNHQELSGRGFCPGWTDRLQFRLGMLLSAPSKKFSARPTT